VRHADHSASLAIAGKDGHNGFGPHLATTVAAWRRPLQASG